MRYIAKVKRPRMLGVVLESRLSLEETVDRMENDDRRGLEDVTEQVRSIEIVFEKSPDGFTLILYDADGREITHSHFNTFDDAIYQVNLVFELEQEA